MQKKGIRGTNHEASHNHIPYSRSGLHLRWTKSRAQADVVSDTFGRGLFLPLGLSPASVPSRGLQAIVGGLSPGLKIGPGPNRQGTTSM